MSVRVQPASRLATAALLAAAAVNAAPAAADNEGELRPPSLKARPTDRPKPPEPDETEEARKRRRRAELRLPSQLAEMVEELDASDAQTQAIRKRLAEKEAAIKKWKEGADSGYRKLRDETREAQKRLREVRKQLKEAGIESAARDRDPRYKKAAEAVRRLQDRSRELREKEKALARAEDAKVLAVFTRRQMARWETVQVAKLYRRQWKNKPVLTHRQLDDIDILCEQAARKLASATAGKPPAEAEKVRDKILYDLQVRIYEDVLEHYQRARLPKPDIRRLRRR